MQPYQNLIESNQKRVSKKLVKELLEYRIEGLIGEGNYGKVKYGTHILTGQPVAIKFINKNRLIRPGDMDRIKNEMKIIYSSNHPNILKAYEIFEDESYYYIVMERPERGDLFNYICSKGRLSLDEATFIYYQLVNAVSYLQKMKIAHRDLKPENILLTEDFIVKIGDFGLSKYYQNKNIKMSTICGSPCYSAPEMLRGNKYKPYPIDVWGIGIILYCMICGALPFEDIKEDDLIRKVIQCDYNCPYYVNQNVRTLFKRIFCQNPNERITMEEIKLNCIYNMGKANFMKYYKIFNENGELLPQVQRFIKEKTIKSLQKKIEEQRSLINNLKQENNNLEQKIEETNSQLDTLYQEKERLINKKRAINEFYTDKQNEIEKIHELDKYKLIEDYEDQMREISQNYLDKKTEYIQGMQEIDDKTKEINNEKEEEKRAMWDEIDRLKNEGNNIDKETEYLTKSNEELNNKLKETSNSIDLLRANTLGNSTSKLKGKKKNKSKAN